VPKSKKAAVFLKINIIPAGRSEDDETGKYVFYNVFSFVRWDE